MILQLPNDFIKKDQLEYLGYGFALPAEYLYELISGVLQEDDSVRAKQLIPLDDHWYRLNR